MLDFGTAIDLLKQYGYSSTTSHPYLYQTEDAIGICYVYNDDEFGSLERVKMFKDLESFEQFLKELEWVKVNGVQKHVRMILDNYEAVAPKVMYLRNEKLMVEGEMFDIDNFDFREAQRESMDATSQVIYEAGDLLLVYDEMKGRQLQYLKNIIKLKNSLRQKYFDLQKEVDEYNKYKITRELRLLPEIADSGINETMEIALKDKYNMYIAERPPYEEACEFLKEVWDLCMQLELNLKYYDAQKEENDVHNELRMVNQKLELMMQLNDEGRPLFGVDLVGKFRKINKVCLNESSFISTEWIHEQAENIERKYAVFDNIDIINTSDYLREAIQNSNYADLAIKYRKGVNIHERMKAKTPLNEVAANLSLQYSNSLTPQEQAVLVLYNNHKYRKLCDAILRVENFEQLPVKKVISIISKTKEYSKIKSIVYDAVKKRINDPVNESIKNSIFGQFDFSTYETFITSIINSLIQLKSINTKMALCGDINMYITVDSVDEINNCRFTNVTNALNDLLGRTKGTKTMIGIVLLKEGTPVLYSPYYLDFGDIYNKGASLQMSIKEMVDFELLVDCSDIIINIDPKKTTVVRYYSTPKTVEDVSVVSELKMNFKTVFCKYAFTSKFSENVVVNNTVPVTNVALDVATNMVSNEGFNPVVTNVGVSEVPVSDAPVNEVPVISNVAVDNEVVVNNDMPIVNNDVNNVVPDNIVPEVNSGEIPTVVPVVDSNNGISESNEVSAMDLPMPAVEENQDTSGEEPVTNEEDKKEEISNEQEDSSKIEPVSVVKEEEKELEDTGKVDSTVAEESKDVDTDSKEESNQSNLPVIEPTSDEIKVGEEKETNTDDKEIDNVIPVPLNMEKDEKVVEPIEKDENQSSEDSKKEVSIDIEKKNNTVPSVKPVISDIHEDGTKPVVKPVSAIHKDGVKSEVKPVGSGMRPVGVARKPMLPGMKRPMNPGMQQKSVPVRKDGVKPPVRSVPNGVKPVNSPVRPVEGMIKQGQRPISNGAKPRMVRPGVRMVDGKPVPPVIRKDGQRPNVVPHVKPVNGINSNTGPENGAKRVMPPKINGMPVGVNGVKRPVSGERPIRKMEGPVREGMRSINPQARMNHVPIKREDGGNTGSSVNRLKPKTSLGTKEVRINDKEVKPVSSGLVIGSNNTDTKKVGSVNNEKS